MTPAERLLRPYLRRQDGAVTTAQALAAGVTAKQLRGLRAKGWSSPVRGVYVEPNPADPFRTQTRAALLACRKGAAFRITSARVYQLWGLPRWTPSELPELLVPRATSRAQRAGMRLYFGLEPGDTVVRTGLAVTTLAVTVAALSGLLRLPDLVCLLDSAMRAGWQLDGARLTGPTERRLRQALALTDARSESALETLLRLLLRSAGLDPEVLQLQLYDRTGACFARLDFAWPSRRLAVEADGREHHDKPDALYRDRRRQNQITLAGWTVLRFTWFDVVHRPQWVIAQVQQALAAPVFEVSAPDRSNQGRFLKQNPLSLDPPAR